MFASRDDNIQEKDFQLLTVLLHAVPRDITCRDCAALLRILNAAYSIALLKKMCLRGQKERRKEAEGYGQA